jgi:hypothetical protein
MFNGHAFTGTITGEAIDWAMPYETIMLLRELLTCTAQAIWAAYYSL